LREREFCERIKKDKGGGENDEVMCRGGDAIHFARR